MYYVNRYWSYKICCLQTNPSTSQRSQCHSIVVTSGNNSVNGQNGFLKNKNYTVVSLPNARTKNVDKPVDHNTPASASVEIVQGARLSFNSNGFIEVHRFLKISSKVNFSRTKTHHLRRQQPLELWSLWKHHNSHPTVLHILTQGLIVARHGRH